MAKHYHKGEHLSESYEMKEYEQCLVLSWQAQYIIKVKKAHKTNIPSPSERCKQPAAANKRCSKVKVPRLCEKCLRAGQMAETQQIEQQGFGATSRAEFR